MRLDYWPVRALTRDLDRFSSFFDRIFHRPLGEAGDAPPANVPAVNISENDAALKLSFEMPGFDEEAIDVQILGDQLTVSAERKFEDEEKTDKYHRIEHSYGKTSRSIQLPAGLRKDSESVDATYKNGILTVTLKKVEETPAAKIRIKSE